MHARQRQVRRMRLGCAQRSNLVQPVAYPIGVPERPHDRADRGEPSQEWRDIQNDGRGELVDQRDSQGELKYVRKPLGNRDKPVRSSHHRDAPTRVESLSLLCVFSRHEIAAEVEHQWSRKPQ